MFEEYFTTQQYIRRQIGCVLPPNNQKSFYVNSNE